VKGNKKASDIVLKEKKKKKKILKNTLSWDENTNWTSNQGKKSTEQQFGETKVPHKKKDHTNRG